MTETAQTIKDTVETLSPYLDKLADNIGNNGTYVFGLMVKQVYIDGIICIIYGIISIICVFAAYRIDMKGKEIHKKHNQSILESEEYKIAISSLSTEYYPDGYINSVKKSLGFEFEEQFSRERTTMIIVFFSLCIIFLAYFIVNFRYAISCFINPEYQAIIQLLHAIK